MTPLIAITCARTTVGAWTANALGQFADYALSDYSQAIRHAGGAPVIVPSAQDGKSLERILDAVQGLVLSGGPDVHPRHYGQQPLPALGMVDDTLDRMELEAARMAIARDLPLLAICRGIQLLNVAMGGTLYQDIPSQVPGSICHAPKIDKSVHSHTVTIVANSLLQRLCGGGEIWVNSQHHQAIRDLAPSLSANAHAPDGLIEAIAHPSKTYVLGVQWHPEGTWRNDGCARQLFASFLTAAGSR